MNDDTKQADQSAQGADEAANTQAEGTKETAEETGTAAAEGADEANAEAKPKMRKMRAIQDLPDHKAGEVFEVENEKAQEMMHKGFVEAAD